MAKKNALHLRELLVKIPEFCFDFFRGIEPTTSPKTRIAYAYDLQIFFHFLINSIDYFKSKDLSTLQVEELDQVTPRHLEQFLEYLSVYQKEPENTIPSTIKREHQNSAKGKARKLATLRTFYNYFYKKQYIKTTPTSLVDMPKIHEKNIVRLEVDEVARLLDFIEHGDGLSTKQKQYHRLTANRDLALVTLLLGTGIRVSECVGLNLKDVDFEVNGLKVTRKGGNEVIVYFGEEVENALKGYLTQRLEQKAKADHQHALFLSLQKTRLSVRSVQNLVKKYAKFVTSLKEISPHKLRSTYGTNLYQETGDIYLVADVLGHKDVNTTKKHYAQIEDARRRQAAKVVKLRK